MEIIQFPIGKFLQHVLEARFPTGGNFNFSMKIVGWSGWWIGLVSWFELFMCLACHLAGVPVVCSFGHPVSQSVDRSVDRSLGQSVGNFGGSV